MMFILSVVGCLTFANAQNDTVLYIENYENDDVVPICVERHQRVLIYAENGCDNFSWEMYALPFGDVNPLVVESDHEETTTIRYYGCNIPSCIVYIAFREERIPNSFSRTTWKRSHETAPLEAVMSDSLDEPFYYRFHWSTGETTPTIEVTEPGIYTCEVIDACGSATRTIIVKDNVEATLATTDLATNLNVVTWQTTDEQAEYVSQVKVYRDGALVGTAPYADGSFTDNIGSEAASRTYTVLAVAPDGTDCPILSHPKETIHMTYTLGVGNTIVIGWNHPTGYDLVGYNICEWHPGAKDDELTVIDYVGAGVSSYTCSESQFDHGMIVVQGVERTKDAESRLLSNRSLDYVGIGEKENKIFNLYPNPTTGRVTIEGTGRLTITNTLGQTVLTRDITDTETIDLPMGVWFVKLDETTRKIVVE